MSIIVTVTLIKSVIPVSSASVPCLECLDSGYIYKSPFISIYLHLQIKACGLLSNPQMAGLPGYLFDGIIE